MADERERRRAGSGQGGGGGGAGSAPNLEAHPLVERLRREEESEAASEVVVLTGYLGPSKVGDNVRLYTDLTFRTYYEVPKGAVRRTVAGREEDDPTQVWVDSSSRVEVVRTTRQSVEAGYLAGSIAGQFMGGGAAGARAASWPVCKTMVTANPTDCGPLCLTVVTANPTDCGPVCLTVVTAVPTDCGLQAAAGAQAMGAGMAGMAARPPQLCITLYTARPTSCGQQYCITLATAIPTWCEGGGMGGGPICLTVVTANPTDCGGGRCLPIRTFNPTMCGPICLTVVTAVPTDCG